MSTMRVLRHSSATLPLSWQKITAGVTHIIEIQEIQEVPVLRPIRDDVTQKNLRVRFKFVELTGKVELDEEVRKFDFFWERPSCKVIQNLSVPSHLKPRASRKNDFYYPKIYFKRRFVKFEHMKRSATVFMHDIVKYFTVWNLQIDDKQLFKAFVASYLSCLAELRKQWRRATKYWFLTIWIYRIYICYYFCFRLNSTSLFPIWTIFDKNICILGPKMVEIGNFQKLLKNSWRFKFLAAKLSKAFSRFPPNVSRTPREWSWRTMPTDFHSHTHWSWKHVQVSSLWQSSGFPQLPSRTI